MIEWTESGGKYKPGMIVITLVVASIYGCMATVIIYFLV